MLNTNKNKLRYGFSLIELSVVIVVIGILITGISSAIDMYTSFKLQVAKNLTLNSRVLRISDLYSWYEMTLDESLEKNEAKQDSKITNWYDINKNAVKKINFLQTNPSLKPTYISSAINGLPAMSFSGSNYMLSDIDTPSIFEYNSASIFFVFVAKSLSQQGFLLTQTYTTCTNNIEIGHNTGNGGSGNFGIHSGCYRATVTPNNTVIKNEPTIVSMIVLPGPIVSNSVENIEIYKNGGDKLSLNADSGGYGSNLGIQYAKGNYSLYLGSRYDFRTTLNAYFSGLIGEVIIYSRVHLVMQKENLLSNIWVKNGA